MGRPHPSKIDVALKAVKAATILGCSAIFFTQLLSIYDDFAAGKTSTTTEFIK